MLVAFNLPGVGETEKPRNLTVPGFLMFGHDALPGSDFLYIRCAFLSATHPRSTLFYLKITR